MPPLFWYTGRTDSKGRPSLRLGKKVSGGHFFVRGRIHGRAAAGSMPVDTLANVNLSKLKNGKVSAIRFSTLEAICDVLDCQPGDILEFQRNK